jgi:hypothetical protein
MGMKMRRNWLFAAVLVSAAVLQAQTWQIGPFTRPANGNPVIAPRPESTFPDPVLKTAVRWEALHTFNPAAIVREGKVFVLYRAEDDSGTLSGEMEIGSHTSRLGLAESEDGVHFTRRADPVFFPTAITCSPIPSGTARTSRWALPPPATSSIGASTGRPSSPRRAANTPI